MHVLLSIKPDHVENILRGVKTFEFRRRIFARSDVRTVLIYCTMPIGRLVGEFDIDSVLEAEPESLWKKTRHGSGISKSYFDSYFDGRDRGYAIKIGEVRTYTNPLNPCDVFSNFTPPQSYMYVTQERLGCVDQMPLF